MEPGYEICPKCDGKGVMRYKVWESRRVLLSLSGPKVGRQRVAGGMWIARIICPGCDGSGKIDWVTKATRGPTLSKPFDKLEGNMDIYYMQAVESWPRNRATHKYLVQDVHYSPERVTKILELSQVRYTGIKLDPRVLTFNPTRIGKLYNSVLEYQGYLGSIPKQEVTEDRIKKELIRRGLNDFMPDKFAIPGPNDFPT
jgi:hypothetical protein